MATVRRDTWFTAMIAVIGVAALTLLVFRWKSHSLLVLVALATGLAWAFGAVRLEYGYLNLITSSFLSTLVGVGVAYGIHPVSEYELSGAHTSNPREAVREAYHRTGAAVTTAAVTTAAAFFSILLMQFRGFSELGLVAGVGVLLCLLSAMVVLPGLLTLYGHWRRVRDSKGRKNSLLDRFWVERSSGFLCLYPRAVVAAALGLTAVCIWSAWGIRFNTNILDLLPREAESVQFQREMISRSDLSPLANMVVADDLDELRGMQERAARERTIERFESVLQFLPADTEASRAALVEVSEVLADVRLPADLRPVQAKGLARSLDRLEGTLVEASDAAFAAGYADLAVGLEEARAAAQRARDTAEGATQQQVLSWQEGQERLLAWARRALQDLRRAAGGEAPSATELPQELQGHFLTKSKRYVAFLHPAGDIFDRSFLPAYVAASRRVSGESTGFPVVFYQMSRRITQGFYRAVAVGFLLVLLILIIDYRRWKDACLAMIPLAMGVAWMLGGMRLLGIDFNFANLVAVPLIIGVGIDNGVHVIHRVRLEGERGMAVVLRHTVRAILIASLTTMIGFGSLALASHRGLASLGLVLLLGVGACLITSTVVLPNILVALGILKR
jgi:predicted RND superfamily exporter protein